MTTSDERERTRRELQQLTRMAEPVSADSSGYVDLSAYSASDPNWVEHALSRSRDQGLSTSAAVPEDRATLRPITLSPLGELHTDVKLVDPSARQRRATLVVGSAVVGPLAIMALTLALRGVPAIQAPPLARVVAAAPLVVTSMTAPPILAPNVVAAATAAGSPSTIGTAESAHHDKGSPHASVKRAPSMPTPRPSPRARATTSTQVSVSQPAAGHDSLMSAMQQTLSTPAKASR
jgi:hypothetical protein